MAKRENAVFVGRDNGVTVVAHPPSIFKSMMGTAARGKTFDISDTPGLVRHLRPLDGKLPIVFIDANKAHVDAVALGISTRSGAITDFAVPSSTEKIHAIMSRDFAGRQATLELPLDAHAESAERELFMRLSASTKSSEWRSAALTTPFGVDDHLKSVHWDVVRDGIPSVVEISFGQAEEISEPRTVEVIAGDVPGGRQRLLATAEAAREAAAAVDASLASYLSQLKNDLKAMSQAQQGRLALVLKHQETQIFFSKLTAGPDKSRSN
jgi:hypothetical protein